MWRMFVLAAVCVLITGCGEENAGAQQHSRNAGSGKGVADNESNETDNAKTNRIKPRKVELFSIQISKLKRDQFGNAKLPRTGKSVAFWLANSGTAILGRFKLDQSVVEFDEKKSRLTRFVDDQGNDLTASPSGESIDTFFKENKPISVKLGPDSNEGEFVIRGYKTPGPGASTIEVDAELVLLSVSDKRVAVKDDVELKEGNQVSAGPVNFTFVDGKEVREKFRKRKIKRLAGIIPTGKKKEGPEIAFIVQPAAKTVESIEWLDSSDEVVKRIDGKRMSDRGETTFLLPKPDVDRVNVRVTYFAESGVVTVPIHIRTSLGF